MIAQSTIRRTGGAVAIATGLLLNEWVLAALFSADGSLWGTTRAAIWCFDLTLVVAGLLLLFASRQLLNNILFSLGLTLVLIVVLDLVARPLLRDKLFYRPEGMYKNRWPQMPSLARYDPNVRYTGVNYGDLAAVSGRSEARDLRTVSFVTDQYGFRNDGYDSSRTLDLIILGDSFGAGVGTTQEKTWCGLLAGRYGLHVYNLSIDGTGPWQEYMDLKLELPRLNVRPGTTVVWGIYVGNDLENPEGHDPGASEMNGWLARLKVRSKSFLKRSPLRMVAEHIVTLSNPNQMNSGVLAKSFLDGREVLFFEPFEAASRRTRAQVLRHPDYAVYQSVLDSMKALADREQLRVAVVIIPTKEEVYGWLLHGEAAWSSDRKPSNFAAVTAELSSQNGFGVLDLKSDLIDSSAVVYSDNKEMLWWHDDIHWNERGNAVAAALVYDAFFRTTSVQSAVQPPEPAPSQ